MLPHQDPDAPDQHADTLRETAQAPATSRGKSWRWLTHMLPDKLLHDADIHFDKDTETELKLDHTFGGKGSIIGFRVVWALLPLLLLGGWIAYNIAAFELQDQLQPGNLAALWEEGKVLKLQSFHNSWDEVVPANKAIPAPLRKRNNTAVFCTCTFSGGYAAVEPPYVQLEPNPGYNSCHTVAKDGTRVAPVGVIDYLNLCPRNCSLNININSRCGGEPIDNTNAFHALSVALAIFTRTVEHARIAVQPTAVMHKRVGWGAASLSAAHEAIVLGYDRAQEELNNRGENRSCCNPKMTLEEVELANCHLDSLYASLLMMSTMLFNVSGPVKQLSIYNETLGRSNVVSCELMPETVDQLPMRLRRFCPPEPVRGGSKSAESTDTLGVPGCNDSYVAYQKWCSPQYCIVMLDKSAITRAVETITAMGGLWTGLTTVMFTILWSAMYGGFKWCQAKHKPSAGEQQSAAGGAAAAASQSETASAVVNIPASHPTDARDHNSMAILLWNWWLLLLGLQAGSGKVASTPPSDDENLCCELHDDDLQPATSDSVDHVANPTQAAMQTPCRRVRASLNIGHAAV